MRVIGRVETKFDGDHVTNAPYMNGLIVELTPYEANLLRALQEACEGREWDIEHMIKNNPYYTDIEDIDMAEAFGMIRLFVEAKFAVNSFKAAVSRLEDTLNRLDKNEL